MSEELEELKGVGSATATKLRQAGFTTLEAVAVAPINELTRKVGLGYEAALKLGRLARDHIGVAFVTAKEIWERRQKDLYPLAIKKGSPQQNTSSTPWVVEKV